MTKQPPAVPLPGPNVTPEPNEKINQGSGRQLFQANKKATRHPQIRKTPWHGVTKQPPAAPVPGPNVTPEPNEKIKGLAGTSTVPGTETKPQDTLQIRKTPWHSVTKQPPAVPLPGPNVTPEPNEKSIKGLAGNCSRHKPSHKTPFKSGKPWRGVTKQPPAVPLPGPNVTPEPNEKIKGLAGNSTVPGTEAKPQDTLRIRKTPWHGVTKQPPAVPPSLYRQTPLLNGIKNQGSGRNSTVGAQSSIVPGTEICAPRTKDTSSWDLGRQFHCCRGTETCAPSTKNTSGWDF